MIIKKRKGWNTDPCGVISDLSNSESGCWKMKLWNIDSNKWKKKGWNFDPNTWNYKFYIPYKIDKKKIEEILKS